MKIILLDASAEHGIVNKDLAGGFGIRPRIGKSVGAKFLEVLRGQEDFPPMAFAYIAAILAGSANEVSYMKDEIPKEADLVIMLPSMSTYKIETKMMDKVKANGIKVGVIGLLASHKPELFDGHADFVVVGEPESFFMKMKNIPKGIVKSEPTANLDEIPFPKWDIFDYKKFSFSPVMEEKPFGFMLSSRSCPYTCYYCPYRLSSPFRARSVKNVADEMEHLVNNYGVKAVMFRDALFTFDRKRTEELCAEIKKRKIKLKWVAETRLDLLDKELIDVLYDAGMRVLKVGVESVDLKLLKDVRRKPIGIVHQEEIIKYCDKKGIKVVAFYIVGLPNDKKENILDTIKYAKKLNLKLKYNNFHLF